MAAVTNKSYKPAINMTHTDHARLSKLAEAPSVQDSPATEYLLSELDRARIVMDDDLSANTVRMGSTLRFTTDLDEDRTVTLVFPGEADISQNKISILTPIGAALIGLSAGQSIDWTARDGRTHRLTVQSVNSSGEASVSAVSTKRQS